MALCIILQGILKTQNYAFIFKLGSFRIESFKRIKIILYLYYISLLNECCTHPDNRRNQAKNSIGNRPEERTRG